MTMVDAIVPGSGDTYRIERSASIATGRTGSPTPYKRAKWWVGAVPTRKRHDQPGDTAATNGETTSTAVKNGGRATHCWS